MNRCSACGHAIHSVAVGEVWCNVETGHSYVVERLDSGKVWWHVRLVEAKVPCSYGSALGIHLAMWEHAVNEGKWKRMAATVAEFEERLRA